MKASELRKLSPSELDKKLAELKDELFKLRFQQAVNQLDNRITLSDNRNELHDLAVTINQALDRIEYGYKQQQQFIMTHLLA